MDRRNFLSSTILLGLAPRGEIDTRSPNKVFDYLSLLKRATSPDFQSFELEAQAWAICGDQAAAQRTWALGAEDDMMSASPNLARIENAHAAVLHRASARRVIFVNEAHHTSRGRSFMATLLEPLRALGYSIFAAEDFTSSVRGADVVTTSEGGLYINDPAYAEMVRLALKNGFELHPYEQGTSAPDQENASDALISDKRELAQARNLARLWAASGQGKMIVFCGFSHALKRSGRPARCAQLFWQLTGEEPFVVHQAEGTLPDDPDHCSRLQRPVHGVVSPGSSVCAWDECGRPYCSGVYVDGVDLAVFHAPDRHQPSRRGLEWFGKSRVVAVPSVFNGLTSLISATDISIPHRQLAVPSDLVVTPAGEALLTLAPGIYRLEEFAEERTSRSKPFIVEAE